MYLACEKSFFFELHCICELCSAHRNIDSINNLHQIYYLIKNRLQNLLSLKTYIWVAPSATFCVAPLEIITQHGVPKALWISAMLTNCICSCIESKPSRRRRSKTRNLHLLAPILSRLPWVLSERKLRAESQLRDNHNMPPVFPWSITLTNTPKATNITSQMAVYSMPPHIYLARSIYMEMHNHDDHHAKSRRFASCTRNPFTIDKKPFLHIHTRHTNTHSHTHTLLLGDLHASLTQ